MHLADDLVDINFALIQFEQANETSRRDIGGFMMKNNFGIVLPPFYIVPLDDFFEISSMYLR